MWDLEIMSSKNQLVSELVSLLFRGERDSPVAHKDVVFPHHLRATTLSKQQYPVNTKWALGLYAYCSVGVPERMAIFNHIHTCSYIYTQAWHFFLSVINFIHISVYMSIPIAQFSTPPSPPHRGFPPLVSIHLFSTSVPQLMPCKPVHVYHFSRFHIHTLIYDICFSLSDLLHSVWQSLDPSTSQQMTQFRSFLWPSNIPLYICTTSSLSSHLLMGI